MGALIDSALGKLIKECFPTITTTRNGQRKKLKYSYVGIAFKLEVDDSISSQNLEDDIGTILAGLKQRIPTLRRCPKGSRIQIAILQSRLLYDITLCNSEDS